MTTEQQRKILECAAKACGVYLLWHERWGCFYDYNKRHESKDFQEWNPLTNPADCSEMCAKLHIDWLNLKTSVICGIDGTGQGVETVIKDHDNSRLKAWMYAATMVAAKIGGYTDA